MNVRLSIPQEQLRDIALQALQIAKDLGASAASCEASESSGLSVTTRKTVVETIENTRDKGIAITIYIGKRRGHSSTSDFAPAALREAVFNVVQELLQRNLYPSLPRVRAELDPDIRSYWPLLRPAINNALSRLGTLVRPRNELGQFV